MLVTCQRFGDLFLFGLVWQYSSVQTKYDKGRFKVMATYLQQYYITLSLPSYTGSALKRELNFCNSYLSVLYFWGQVILRTALTETPNRVKQGACRDFFLLPPHENQSTIQACNNYRLARMDRNFDDYPGCQPKINTCAKICNTVHIPFLKLNVLCFIFISRSFIQAKKYFYMSITKI